MDLWAIRYTVKNPKKDVEAFLGLAYIMSTNERTNQSFRRTNMKKLTAILVGASLMAAAVASAADTATSVKAF